MSPFQDPTQSGTKKLLVILLTISLGFNTILILKRTEVFPSKRKLISSNEMLDMELTKSKNELNRYRGISDKIDQVIKDANKKLEAKEKQLIAITRDKKLKEEENKELLLQIDQINQKYLNAIDSLLVEKKNNELINNKIESLEDIISELNKKIGIAAWLVGDNLTVTPLKKAMSGNMQATGIGKKTRQIEVCLDILENKLTNPGSQEIYFIITTPGGEIIHESAEEDLIFDHPEYKKQAKYSKAEGFNYTNKKVHVCTKIKVEKVLTSGLYLVEVFTKENKLGMTTFTLR